MDFKDKNIVFLDWETFYDTKAGYGLREMSMTEYIQDSRFKAHEEIDDRREKENRDRFYLIQQTINSQFTDIMNELKRRF